MIATAHIFGSGAEGSSSLMDHDSSQISHEGCYLWFCGGGSGGKRVQSVA